MFIAILGSGSVAATIAHRLLGAGHDVVLGARNPATAADREWVRELGGKVQVESLSAAASAGEVVVNATPGSTTVEMLIDLDPASLSGKVLIDTANAVAFGESGPLLMYPNGSLAERIQLALPQARVVKTLNSMNTAVQQDPTGLAVQTSVFVSGDDAEARSLVTSLLHDMGWPPESVIDLGGIASAQGPEHYFLLFFGLARALGTRRFNIAVAR
ncbi:MAG: oxidoreductase [Pseudonocardia sp.]|nr:oxidoreductase [Pseudonocardia sp.]